jgi:hypothetical protein
MKISIMQPFYIPWIGYFNLIQQSDLFVFLDSAQFVKRSWQQRNKIKGANGELVLTIPVKTKGRREQRIMDVEIDATTDFIHKHLRSVYYSYSKAPFFSNYYSEFEAILLKRHRFLSELTIELIEWLSGIFAIGKKFIRSSRLNVSGRKAYLLLDICKAIGAESYLSAKGSQDYIKEDDPFEINDVNVIYQDYVHPRYVQLGSLFVSHLSVIDLLFNEGPRRGREIISAGSALSHTPQ